MALRKVTFDADERKRLAVVCKALGTTFGEFVHFATMQALDEVEGYGRDLQAIREYYERSSMNEDKSEETEPCCDPDYDPARGGYVHAESCQGTER